MKDDLDRLLRDATLVTLAFAIAVGWSLFQFARGVGIFVDALTTPPPRGLPAGVGGRFLVGNSADGFGLTWIVGRRIISLDGMVIGLIELAVVLLIAGIVRRRVVPPS
jgi:hypothetical protein